MRKIFVLTTLINGRKNFVANQMSNRHDNKKIINYTAHPEDARDFGSIKAAKDFITHIVNPHERIFSAETTEVDPEKVKDRLDLVNDMK